MRRRLFTLGALMVALMAPAGAQAYWTSSGTGSGSAQAGSLATPSLSATAGAGTATLTWKPVTSPGLGDVSYNVKRDGVVVGNCPTSVTTTVITCLDSGPSLGRNDYTVTAVWRSWTASSAIQVYVATGAAANLSFTQSPENTSADNPLSPQPKVTVQDQ